MVVEELRVFGKCMEKTALKEGTKKYMFGMAIPGLIAGSIIGGIIGAKRGEPIKGAAIGGLAGEAVGLGSGGLLGLLRGTERKGENVPFFGLSPGDKKKLKLVLQKKYTGEHGW